MDMILGIMLKINNNYNVTLSQNLCREDMSFAADHFQRHVVNSRIWEELLAKEGAINPKVYSAQNETVTDEDTAVTTSHALLANALCSCGSNRPKVFKSAKTWKTGELSYRMLTTYSCPDCQSELSKDEVFSSPKRNWLRRLFSR